jgi:basic membrane protein A
LGKGDVFPPGTPEEEMILPDNMAVHDVGYGSAMKTFISGTIAAKMTKTGKLGYIGGVPYPSVQQGLFAWTAGIRYVNSTMDYSQIVWVGDWSDPGKGGEVARAMYEYGCDIINSGADGTGVGGVAYADKVEGLYVAGGNWAPLMDKYPETIYVTGDFTPDEIIISYVDALMEGTWVEKYGGRYMRISFTDGVLPGFDPPTMNPALVSEELIAYADELGRMLKEGEIDFDALLEEAKALVGVD